MPVPGGGVALVQAHAAARRQLRLRLRAEGDVVGDAQLAQAQVDPAGVGHVRGVAQRVGSLPEHLAHGLGVLQPALGVAAGDVAGVQGDLEADGLDDVGDAGVGRVQVAGPLVGDRAQAEAVGQGEAGAGARVVAGGEVVGDADQDVAGAHQLHPPPRLRLRGAGAALVEQARGRGVVAEQDVQVLQCPGGEVVPGQVGVAALAVEVGVADQAAQVGVAPVGLGDQDDAGGVVLQPARPRPRTRVPAAVAGPTPGPAVRGSGPADRGAEGAAGRRGPPRAGDAPAGAGRVGGQREVGGEDRAHARAQAGVGDADRAVEAVAVRDPDRVHPPGRDRLGQRAGPQHAVAQRVAGAGHEVGEHGRPSREPGGREGVPRRTGVRSVHPVGWRHPW